MTFPKDRLFLNRNLNKNVCTCKLKDHCKPSACKASPTNSLFKTELHLTPVIYLILYFSCFICFLPVACSFFSLIDYFCITYIYHH